MSMTRREIEDFYEFCETLDFGDYDKVMVLDSSLGNTADVPAEDKLECAKNTVLGFLDGAYDE